MATSAPPQTNGHDTILDKAQSSSPSSSTASDPLPTAAELEELYQLPVLDKDKTSTSFGTLIKDPSHARHIVVFIRHFFCGNCQQYLQALSATLTPQKLASLSPPTRLIVIGCGDPAIIRQYARETDCPFEIYADASRALYDRLGFVSNLDRGQGGKPAYMTKSALANLVGSVRQGVQAGSLALSGGKVGQNGGEAVWARGELVFLHRMRATTDHLEVKDLEAVLDGQEQEM